MTEHDDKTARCILQDGDSFLLVVHSNCSPENRGKWGLPGGRLEEGESARCTLRRELSEELFIDVTDLAPVGRYRSRGRWHRVFSSTERVCVEHWDRSEIATVGWFELEEIERLEAEDRLHGGFEAEAVRDLADAASSKAELVVASGGERD